MFRDRQEAGERLGRKLREYSGKDAVVFALLRGGVPVALEVAKAMKAPLELMVARKLGAPVNRELAIGAIAEGGGEYVDPRLTTHFNIDRGQLATIEKQAQAEMETYIHRFKHGKGLPNLRGKTAILIDDGIATGATALAAVRSLRAAGADRVVAATPVLSPHSLDHLIAEVDELVAVEEVEGLSAVSLWYEDFHQISDEEIFSLIENKPSEEFEISGSVESRSVTVAISGRQLKGYVWQSKMARAWVVFAHGSGSSHKSPRQQFVARKLAGAGFCCLLFDLLDDEEAKDTAKVFDIDLLARRLKEATQWLNNNFNLKRKPIAYFGASTGGAAALQAAATWSETLLAVISRGGRPDLAQRYLKEVKAPVLLLVGERDAPVIELNEEAARFLSTFELRLIPGASHLFEEPGALEKVVNEAIEWLDRHLSRH